MRVTHPNTFPNFIAGVSPSSSLGGAVGEREGVAVGDTVGDVDGDVVGEKEGVAVVGEAVGGCDDVVVVGEEEGDDDSIGGFEGDAVRFVWFLSLVRMKLSLMKSSSLIMVSKTMIGSLLLCLLCC